MSYCGIVENQGPGRQWRVYLEESDRALWPVAVRQSPNWAARSFGVLGDLPSRTVTGEQLDELWDGDPWMKPDNGDDISVTLELEGEQITSITPI